MLWWSLKGYLQWGCHCEKICLHKFDNLFIIFLCYIDACQRDASVFYASQVDASYI